MDLQTKNELLHDCLVVIENLLNQEKSYLVNMHIYSAIQLAFIASSTLHSEKHIRNFISNIKLK